jgi:hypothetical protein
MDRLQTFLDMTAGTPPERDARHFRTWQRVSVQVQREVRTLVAETFFADESRVAKDLDRAFTIAVFSACKPCFGRRSMDFTYDAGDLATIPIATRLIGRGLQGRLARISGRLQYLPLRRRFAPVWHADILNAVKRKPRTLLEFLAREASMIDALIGLGAARDERTVKRFLKIAAAAARVLGVDSDALLDLVLRTGIENLVDGRIFEDSDVLAAGSPEARIGGEEDGNDGSPNCGGQVADARVVPDVQACG